MSLNGSQIRAVRHALGLSVPHLATVLGVHQSTVHRWESAVDSPASVEGMPATLLQALAHQVDGSRVRPEILASKGREISDALGLGGALLALELLIGVARWAPAAAAAHAVEVSAEPTHASTPAA